VDGICPSSAARGRTPHRYEKPAFAYLMGAGQPRATDGRVLARLKMSNTKPQRATGLWPAHHPAEQLTLENATWRLGDPQDKSTYPNPATILASQAAVRATETPSGRRIMPYRPAGRRIAGSNGHTLCDLDEPPRRIAADFTLSRLHPASW